MFSGFVYDIYLSLYFKITEGIDFELLGLFGQMVFLVKILLTTSNNRTANMADNFIRYLEFFCLNDFFHFIPCFLFHEIQLLIQVSRLKKKMYERKESPLASNQVSVFV